MDFLRYIFSIFHPADYQPGIKSKVLVDREYRYWRKRIFYSMFFGYVMYYFSRKSFTFLVPELHELGYSYTELGVISTVLYLTYGISKLISGIFSDRANPRYFMSVGLILTGICNICFGFSSSIFALAFFWGLNGWFQGWGWPPITKMLTYWYGQKERGMWWSFCSTSHNVGGALIAVLVPICITLNFYQFSGWQMGVFIPGLMCIAIGLFLLNRLRDVPQSLGLPSIEEYQGETILQAPEDSSEFKVMSVKEILLQQVLNNRLVWVMGITSFLVYVVRTAVNDWTMPYLVEVKGISTFGSSSSVALFEAGGLIGMLVAGWCSDVLFRGKRVPFMLLCAIGMAASLYGLWIMPHSNGLNTFEISWQGLQLIGLKSISVNSLFYSYVLMTAIGFFVYGPQMLVGIAAAEYVDKKAACSANGFVGCWAYLGAATTGIPLGKVIDYSWDLYFLVLILCCFATFIILIPITITKTKKSINFAQKGISPQES